MRHMLNYLRLKEDEDEDTTSHQRFLQVVVDILGDAPRVGTYLPWSSDAALEPTLRRLQDHPEDNMSIAEHARIRGVTERTLIRKCLRDLGMTFSEWKQRLRVIKAMPLLEADESVEAVALALGYGSASSFIAMFKRLSGLTPDEYRHSSR